MESHQYANISNGSIISLNSGVTEILSGVAIKE